MSDLETRPGTRQPLASVHPTITEGQISDLVEQFYARVLKNHRLAPIFINQTSGRWEDHLDKMKTFWRSVLLRSGEYKGKPVPAHQRLEGVSTEDFEVWLSLFTQTSRAVFHVEAAPLVDEAARRIATSLWLSRSNDPFATPPDWSRPVLSPYQTNQNEKEGQDHESHY